MSHRWTDYMTLLPLFQPRWHRRTFRKTLKKNEADLTRSFSWNYACKKSFEILDPRRFVCEVSFPFSYRCIPTWGHHSKVVVITICSVKSMSIGLVVDNAWVEFLIDQYNHSCWDFRRWNAMYNVIEYIENQIYFKGKKIRVPHDSFENILCIWWLHRKFVYTMQKVFSFSRQQYVKFCAEKLRFL